MSTVKINFAWSSTEPHCRDPSDKLALCLSTEAFSSFIFKAYVGIVEFNLAIFSFSISQFVLFSFF